MSYPNSRTTDKYVKVRKQAEKAPENEVRIKAVPRIGRYISYAATLLLEKKLDIIILKASGNAAKSACQIAEILRHRIVGLHQLNLLKTVSVTDEYEPKEEGLDRVVVERQLAVLEIHLSLKDGAFDIKNVGYQLPLPKDQVQEEDLKNLLEGRKRGPDDNGGDGENRPRNRGYRRGGRRGGYGSRGGRGGYRRDSRDGGDNREGGDNRRGGYRGGDNREGGDNRRGGYRGGDNRDNRDNRGGDSRGGERRDDRRGDDRRSGDRGFDSRGGDRSYNNRDNRDNRGGEQRDNNRGGDSRGGERTYTNRDSRDNRGGDNRDNRGGNSSQQNRRN